MNNITTGQKIGLIHSFLIFAHHLFYILIILIILNILDVCNILINKGFLGVNGRD